MAGNSWGVPSKFEIRIGISPYLGNSNLREWLIQISNVIYFRGNIFKFIIQRIRMEILKFYVGWWICCKIIFHESLGNEDDWQNTCCHYFFDKLFDKLLIGKLLLFRKYIHSPYRYPEPALWRFHQIFIISRFFKQMFLSLLKALS